MTTLGLVITTYNRPAALERMLEAVARQQRLPDEVVVADDGSEASTAESIGKYSSNYPCPLHHVWQEDLGFRAAAIRNRAVARSCSDYLVFLDGDSLPVSQFVGQHLRMAEQGFFVAGQRILLSEELTKKIEFQGEDWSNWGGSEWLKYRLTGQINRLQPLLRLPGQSWRRLTRNRWQGVQTCNLGVWREDFAGVNGFDESYEGWGHEDADFAIRLMHHGTRRKNGRYAAPILHMWHQGFSRDQEGENKALLHECLNNPDRVCAKVGYSQYV